MTQLSTRKWLCYLSLGMGKIYLRGLITPFIFSNKIVIYLLLSTFNIGESYLAEQFRQIIHYLAEQFRQIAHYLAEHLIQKNDMLFNEKFLNASSQVCMYASLQICKHGSMTVCMNASMQE